MSKTNNNEDELIRKVKAFNMGWLNFPKYQWRGIAVLIVLIGFLFFFSAIVGQTQTQFFPPFSNMEFGLMLMFFGALIHLLND